MKLQRNLQAPPLSLSQRNISTRENKQFCKGCNGDLQDRCSLALGSAALARKPNEHEWVANGKALK